MKFEPALVQASLVRREKRFFAYCLLEGQEVVAHCANSGSMKGNCQAGSKVWLYDFGDQYQSTGRKLRYKWIGVESNGVTVLVDTSAANVIVAEALKCRQIPELVCDDFKPEYKVGDSRLDFWIPGQPETFVEVKSVSMGLEERGFFPDSVTERGTKHLKLLQKLALQGQRAVLFFLLTRDPGESVSIASDIDPVYSKALDEAVANGVEVLAYKIQFTESQAILGRKVRFQ